MQCFRLIVCFLSKIMITHPYPARRVVVCDSQEGNMNFLYFKREFLNLTVLPLPPTPSRGLRLSRGNYGVYYFSIMFLKLTDYYHCHLKIKMGARVCVLPFNLKYLSCLSFS